MWKIGSLEVENRLVLAPMAGFTDMWGRRVARRYGAGLVYSEMVSAAGLARKARRTLDMLKHTPSEHPLAIQLFGAKPEEMGEAARIAEGHGAAIIDLNFGCPVKKVCRTGAGAALSLRPDRIARILEEVRRAVRCPVTVKMRLGWDEKQVNVLEVARVVEQSGVDAIALHPRTRAQGFEGAADWEWIARLKRESRIPIMGNGDIVTPQEAARVLTAGMCDAVMIGRATRGNPWIFGQTLALLAGTPPHVPSHAERYGEILYHVEGLLSLSGSESGVKRICFLLLHYVKGLPHVGWFRRQLPTVTTEPQLRSLLKEFFEKVAASGNP